MNSMIAIANSMVASVAKASDMVAAGDLSIAQQLRGRLYQRGWEPRRRRHTTLSHETHCPVTEGSKVPASKPFPGGWGKSKRLAGLNPPLGGRFGRLCLGSFGSGLCGLGIAVR
ncbi:MAG: hypothetical protein R3B96_13380 [Pirellulaceae bacterium]